MRYSLSYNVPGHTFRYWSVESVADNRWSYVWLLPSGSVDSMLRPSSRGRLLWSAGCIVRVRVSGRSSRWTVRIACWQTLVYPVGIRYAVWLPEYVCRGGRYGRLTSVPLHSSAYSYIPLPDSCLPSRHIRRWGIHWGIFQRQSPILRKPNKMFRGYITHNCRQLVL